MMDKAFPLNKKLGLSGYLYRIWFVIENHGIKLFIPVFIWLLFSWSNILPNNLQPSQHISINFYSSVIGTLTDHYTNVHQKITRNDKMESKLLERNKELLTNGQVDRAISLTLSTLLRSDYNLGLTIVSYLILTGSFILTNIDRQIIILLVTLQIIASYNPEGGIKLRLITIIQAIYSSFLSILSESGSKLKNSILIIGIITFLLYRFHSLALVGFSYTLLAGALFFSLLDYLVILLLISYQTLLIYQILTQYSYSRVDFLKLINKSGNIILGLLIEKTRECFKYPIIISFTMFTLVLLRAIYPDLLFRHSSVIFYLRSGLIWAVVLSWIHGIYLMITRRWFFEIEYITDDTEDDYEPYELAQKLMTSQPNQHMFIIILGGSLLTWGAYIFISPQTRLGEFVSYGVVSAIFTFLLIINGIRYTNLKQMFFNEQGTHDKLKWFFQTPLGLS